MQAVKTDPFVCKPSDSSWSGQGNRSFSWYASGNVSGFLHGAAYCRGSLKGRLVHSAFSGAGRVPHSPVLSRKRTDLIQTVTFHTAEEMIAFCQAIQENSPINSYVTPYPSEMPGYEDEVIMAAGTFIQGASIELSADGPIRAPYTAYVQGGLTYTHVKIAIIEAVKTLKNQGFIS